MLNGTCRGCVFVRMLDGKQIGCSANRLFNIIDEISGKNAFVAEDGVYAKYDRLCDAYRPKEWLLDENIEPEDIFERLEKELQPKIGYVLVFNKSLKDLKNTLDSIKDPYYVIIINSHIEYNPEIFEICESLLKNMTFQVISLFDNIPHNHKLDKAFRYCKNGWIAFVNTGYIFPQDFKEKVYDYVYKKMNKLGVIFSYTKDKLFVQAKIFKFLGGNLPKILEDGTIDKDDFYMRLKKVKIEDKNLVQSWEGFFENE